MGTEGRTCQIGGSATWLLLHNCSWLVLAVLLGVLFVSFLAKMSDPDGGARDDGGEEFSPAQIACIERMIAAAGQAAGRADPPATTGDTGTSASSTSPDQGENSHTSAGTVPALEVDATSCTHGSIEAPIRGYGACLGDTGGSLHGQGQASPDGRSLTAVPRHPLSRYGTCWEGIYTRLTAQATQASHGGGGSNVPDAPLCRRHPARPPPPPDGIPRQSSHCQARCTESLDTRPWQIMLQNVPIMLCRNSLRIPLLCLGLVLFCSHSFCLSSHYAHSHTRGCTTP